MTKLLIAFVTLSVTGWAGIGDNAPSIPSAYVLTHRDPATGLGSRIGSPPNSFLNSLWATNHSTGAYAGYAAAANAWTNSGGIGNCRYTLTAYLADRLNSGPNHTAWLTTIKAMYNAAQPLCVAMAYDWVYSDLDATDKANFLTALDGLSTLGEENWNYYFSPYSDVPYLRGVMPIMALAAVQYPDSPVTGLAHLRYAMDWLYNIVLPVWKQQIAGYCTASSTDSDPDCGGAWYDDWDQYTGFGANSLNAYIVPNLLAWANASGRGTALFTTDFPWVKNYAYWLMYLVRPDWTFLKFGTMAYGYFQPEYIAGVSGGGVNRIPANLGSIEGIAAIYNDPTIRGWVRKTNWVGATPDGFEPSAYPWFTPDSSANSTTARTALAKTKNFPGWGTLIFRTGWGEDDAVMSLRYGDSYWSHPSQDVGDYQVYKNGALVNRSGTYIGGAGSQTWQFYGAQAIAHNVPNIMDPSDYYPTETIEVSNPAGGPNVFLPVPNEGGQRRPGSGYGNIGALSGFGSSPADRAGWDRGREWFHEGKLIGWAVGASNAYSYASIDITAAYNNTGSRGVRTGNWQQFTPNTSNRSNRAQSVTRSVLFIPRGTSAYVMVYDRIVSTDSSFVKKDIIHTINAPTLGSYTGGKSYTVARAETVTAAPYPNLWPQVWASNITHCPGGCTNSSTQYSYSGKLYGFITDLPSATTVNQANVGGPGHEYDIAGTNYADCNPGATACQANFLGSNPLNQINGDPNYGPTETGQYRIEQTPGSAAKEDWFFNFQLATDTTTANTSPFTSNPTTVSSGTNCVEGADCNWVTTAVDAGCTIVITVPKRGSGGHLTTSGSGCASIGVAVVDEDLYTHQGGVNSATTVDIPVNTWVHMGAGQVTGSTYGGPPYAPQFPAWDLAQYVPALDCAMVWGSWRDLTGEIQRNTFCYQFDENRLNLMDSASSSHDEHMPEAGHIGQQFGVDPVFSVMMGFGTQSGGRMSERHLLDYWYDFSAGAGRLKDNGGTYAISNTSMNEQGTGIFDPVNRKFIYHSNLAKGTSIYDPYTNTWTANVVPSCVPASTSNCPSATEPMPSMAYRKADSKVYMVNRDGLYRFSPVALTWENLTSSLTGSVPTWRQGAVWQYMEDEDKFFLHGGSMGSTCPCTIYHDTFVIDPNTLVSTAITPAGTPPAGEDSVGLGNVATYLPGWGVIAIWQGNKPDMATPPLFLYRYRQGAKAGGLVRSYNYPAGSFNRNTNAGSSLYSQADRPSVASDGTNVYIGQTEYGNQTVAAASNPYAKPYAVKVDSSGTKTNLGSAYDSMENYNSGFVEADDISMAYSGGSLWACWHSQYDPTFATDHITVKRWNGSTWTDGGRMSSVSGVLPQVQCKIADVDGTPHWVFRERSSSNIFWQNLYVAYWNGSAIQMLGGALNRGGANAKSLDTEAIAGDGSGHPCVAHTEFTVSYTTSATVPQVYVDCWNGSAWVAQGGSVNLSTAHQAHAVSLTVMSGVIYVAFVERQAESASGGASHLLVRKSTIGSGTWATVGAYLNRDQSNGWAFRPEITNSGGNLYVTWAEQGNSITATRSSVQWNYALAQRPKVYAAKYSSGSWSYLGGALNVNTASGSAVHPSIAIVNSSPVVAWRETAPGTTGQIYAKQWSTAASDWVSLGSVSSPIPVTIVPLSNFRR